MESDLIITRIEPHTEEWFQFRKNGIGGSEVGTILGLNKYDTVVRLFHEKIHTIEPRREDNERMFFGRLHEDNIANVWRYYDGTPDGYIKNFKEGKIVRECRNVNGYVVNPKYPWLFASLDRVMQIKGGFNLITGEALETEAVLECKTLSYFAANMWQDGIPIYYLCQVHQYMIILETDYAEIAVLKDGNQFYVEKIQRDPQLCEKIISITKQFWENRVLPAKEAKAKRDAADLAGNMAEAEKWEGVIQHLEPEPDTEEAYKEFMEERFIKEREKVDGTMELYALAKRDEVLRGVNGRIDEERTGLKNVFLKYMLQSNADLIDFGKLGNITFSERKGSKNRTGPTVRIKEKPTENQIEGEFRKIDQNLY